MFSTMNKISTENSFYDIFITLSLMTGMNENNRINLFNNRYVYNQHLLNVFIISILDFYYLLL